MSAAHRLFAHLTPALSLQGAVAKAMQLLSKARTRELLTGCGLHWEHQRTFKHTDCQGLSCTKAHSLTPGERHSREMRQYQCLMTPRWFHETNPWARLYAPCYPETNTREEGLLLKRCAGACLGLGTDHCF